MCARDERQLGKLCFMRQPSPPLLRITLLTNTLVTAERMRNNNRFCAIYNILFFDFCVEILSSVNQKFILNITGILI